MQRPGWHTFVLVLMAAGSANATVIASGGGPAIGVRVGLQAHAEDPLVIDHDDFYDETRSDPAGNGATSSSGNDFVAQSFASFDGESTVVGSSGTASYSYQLFHDADGLANGSILLSTTAYMSINESYFVDPDPNDLVPTYAVAYGRAEAIDFMDLDIVGTDHLFDFSGGVQDDNAGLDSILSHFFFMADITSGFDLLGPGVYSDSTANDFAETTFADSFLLLAGHQYRLGIGSATDYLCTATDASLCPALDQNGEPVASAPQPAGFYGQSGSSRVDFTLTAVPEPGTALLLGAGLAALAAAGRRTRGC